MKHIALILMGLSSLVWSNFSLDNDIIKDSETKLEWQKEVKDLEWQNAISYCENLQLDGMGWRLPSKKDIISIINVGNDNSDLNMLFFNQKIIKKEFDYWTSTIDEESNLRWGANYNGWTGLYPTTYGLQVRCVRGQLTDINLPMTETYDTNEGESKPFSDEKGGFIIILGEDGPSY